MAESMSQSARTGMHRGALLLCCCLAASVVVAETLVDPTRPPAVLEGGDAALASGGPVLQFVLIGPGRLEAIISGQTVSLGGKVGDAQIIKITETEVVLRNGKDLQTLKLFPSIEKQLTYRRVSTNPGKRESEK
jgi:MSHA biogenesis protein MshK